MSPRSFVSQKVLTCARGLALLLIVIGLVGQLFQLVNPTLVGRTINIFAKGIEVESFYKWPLLILASWLGAAAMNALFQYVDSFASGSLRREVQKTFFRAQVVAPPNSDKPSPGELSVYIREASDSSVSLFNIFTFDISRIVVLFIGASVILWTIQPLMVVALAVWSLLFIWYSNRSAAATSAGSRRFIEAKGQFARHIVDVFSHVHLVRSFGTARFEEKQLAQVSEQEYFAFSRFKQLLSRLGFEQMALKSIFSAILFAQASYECLNGRILVGDIAMVLQLSLLITQQVESFSLRLLTLHADQGALTEALRKAYPLPQADSGEDLAKGAPSVHLRNLNFAHPNAERIFDDLSLDIQPGEFVVIVGESGTGKSTLLQLIKRRLISQSGTVKLGEKDIRSISERSLHRVVKEVDQNTSLFDRSIAENVFYGIEQPDNAEIARILDLACLTDVIHRDGRGLNFQVGDRGHRLSGGERQRIAIARCMAHPYELLLLDEATSALDDATEKKVLRSLREHTKGRTVIAVTHRPAVIEIADKVYELRDRKLHLRS